MSRREPYLRNLALAGLLVCAAVVGGVGPTLVGSAEAQTDSYSRQFSGGYAVTIDTSNLSTQVTVEVSTGGITSHPNGTVIVREEIDGSTAGKVRFTNANAYDSYTVTVKNATAQPSFTKSSVAGTTPDYDTHLGTTGGDKAISWGLADKFQAMLEPDVPQVDRQGLPTTVNTSGTDAKQVKIDTHASAESVATTNARTINSYDNRLQSIQTQALAVAKSTYVRELNSGASKSAALTAVNNTVEDFYAKRQASIVRAWNQQIARLKYLDSVTESETNIATGYVQLEGGTGTDVGTVVDYSKQSMTLVNGSSVTIYAIAEGDSGDWNHWTGSSGDTDNDGTPWQVKVNQNGGLSSYPTVTALNLDPWTTAWDQAGANATNVKAQMKTVVDNTYSGYQQGEINSTDLLDPYAIAANRSMGADFQTWAAATLTATGQNTPGTLDSTGSFEVVMGNKSYQGILTSPENPPSGQFSNGTTYDPATITGTQYLITPDRIVTLDQKFTLERIEGSGGEPIQNTTVQKIQYKTTNVTQLKQLFEDYQYRRAQIEAREQALAGGGGLFSSAGGSTVAIAAIVGAAFLLLKD